MGPISSRSDAAAADASDPLAGLRGRFVFPAGIYLAGNSLGPAPRSAVAALATAASAGWGGEAVSAWHTRDWWGLPDRVGGRLARLLGVGPDEVVCGDSTSVQLFQVLTALVRDRPGRDVIAVDAGEFPGDGYVAQAVARVTGRRVQRVDPLTWTADASTAVVAFSAVNYATGALLDRRAIGETAHRAGALVCWDLAHATGVVPLDLAAEGADAAVGCTYKYLCGGPGAPAFLYVPREHQEGLDLPLTGWHGHAEPFGMEPSYRPGPGLARARIGTPPVLSMLAVEAALDLWDEVAIDTVRAKSTALTGLVIDRADRDLGGHDVDVVTPRAPARRGSHVALRLARGGFEVSRALAEAGVVVDFRAPDLVRLGLSPLTNSYVEAWDAMDVLADVLDRRTWRHPRFSPDGRTVT